MYSSHPQNSKRSDRFNAVALKVASPEMILSWSHGEITKPETINYRTQKPELDGLFCERIFGPTKNWECYCGKYKKIRYKGVICEKCGVEVTRAIVRRERMGHISLAVPVAHTWFFRSTPSRIGLVLDIPVKGLEQIIYFASYIVISVDEHAKTEALEDLENQYKTYRKKIMDEYKDELSQMKQKKKLSEEDVDAFEAEKAKKIEELKETHDKARKELESIQKWTLMTELEYRELNMKFGHVFKAGTGAESLRVILEQVEMDELIEELEEEVVDATGQKQKKTLKRIRFLKSLKRAGILPEWMVLKELPVIPPDLRPMVQLDGGRFAASDLNDLYRRIINRNNRLKRLIAIGAPEVICRNEKRMLQEAVDTLLNNSSRGGRAVFTSGDRRKLRSLSDMLKGKQGRFRQNLLGKRVDYSGRSVIVIGPELGLHQCGLPKELAMKLFKPFIIGELIRGEFAHNVKGAEKIIQSGKKIVWDILDDVIKGKYVLLNRAPTLHRLGIQAFSPILIEGKAIQIHPLVCAAFNADFDGDQMAVHLPLSTEAQREAREIMLSSHNLLKPSSGEPIITPTQDMVLGVYFLTQIHDGKKGEGMAFASEEEAIFVYESGHVDLQAKVRIRVDGQIIETSVGRVIFNKILPDNIPFENSVVNKNRIERIISEIYDLSDTEVTASITDKIKKLGFEYATKSGITIGMNDMKIPKEKEKILEEATQKVLRIGTQYWNGLITDEERYNNAIKIWAQAKSDISVVMIENYKHFPENDIFYMIDSGARGNWGQVTQLCGIKGLVASPSGRTIELPIKANLKEGFSILEYFIATHGGRKGKSDTALKTAEAGYLTRRLVDAVQDIIIREEDCKSVAYLEISRKDSEKIGEKFERRIYGRTLAEDLLDPKTKEIIAKRNEEIGNRLVGEISKRKVETLRVRCIMNCETPGGICQKCYGRDLGSNRTVEIGTPVGIIAAQSIGEPGTQLTMRTFHMGGVAEGADITQGLTRVEELFEARPPKTPATLADVEGEVIIERGEHEVFAHIKAQKLGQDEYHISDGAKVSVKEGDLVKENQILAKDQKVLRAIYGGKVIEVTERKIVVKHTKKAERKYSFPSGDMLKVETGTFVQVGTPLTYGHYNLRELLEKTDTNIVQKYITSEVQNIYASQGQTINDKHIEIIVREMFSRVRIIDQADMLDVLPGEIIEYRRIKIFKKEHPKKKPPRYEQLILGLTRISLATDSWLSAASFQETIRVLVSAATTGKIDHLDGLKENVIIGKLIPAGSIYRRRYFEKHES
ncbi:DNA-directed RNA polymerase subunit beta' [Candidatus Peregrinibacteria bacterium]|nr:DNA-directed RNA polymerase subunit beta' [Candidatus Peregrinibacteria bacterium]